VAGAAGTDHLGVVDAVGRRPRSAVMAGITRVCRIDVVDVFTGCNETIVAGVAGTIDLRVIDAIGRRPQRRVVA